MEDNWWQLRANLSINTFCYGRENLQTVGYFSKYRFFIKVFLSLITDACLIPWLVIYVAGHDLGSTSFVQWDSHWFHSLWLAPSLPRRWWWTWRQDPVVKRMTIIISWAELSIVEFLLQLNPRIHLNPLLTHQSVCVSNLSFKLSVLIVKLCELELMFDCH